MFLVFWKSLLTEAAGNGTQGFPKDVAQKICDDANKEWAGIITHWIEPVPNNACTGLAALIGEESTPDTRDEKANNDTCAICGRAWVEHTAKRTVGFCPNSPTTWLAQ